MSARKWVAVFVIVGLIALFVPFIPYTSASGQFFGAHYQSTADVSPSYYAFHCGSYMNSRISAQLGSGFSGFYNLAKGYTFTCVYNSG